MHYGHRMCSGSHLASLVPMMMSKNGAQTCDAKTCKDYSKSPYDARHVPPINDNAALKWPKMLHSAPKTLLNIIMMSKW